MCSEFARSETSQHSVNRNLESTCLPGFFVPGPGQASPFHEAIRRYFDDRGIQTTKGSPVRGNNKIVENREVLFGGHASSKGFGPKKHPTVSSSSYVQGYLLLIWYTKNWSPSWKLESVMSAIDPTK